MNPWGLFCVFFFICRHLYAPPTNFPKKNHGKTAIQLLSYFIVSTNNNNNMNMQYFQLSFEKNAILQ